MNTKYLRKHVLNNITQKEFADTFRVPYATVRNWDARDCMPEYVLDLLRYRVRMEQVLYNLDRMYPNDEALARAIGHSQGLIDWPKQSAILKD